MQWCQVDGAASAGASGSCVDGCAACNATQAAGGRCPTNCFCESSDDCAGDRYCDAANTCYDCLICEEYEDAIEGACPPCTTFNSTRNIAYNNDTGSPVGCNSDQFVAAFAAGIGCGVCEQCGSAVGRAASVDGECPRNCPCDGDHGRCGPGQLCDAAENRCVARPNCTSQAHCNFGFHCDLGTAQCVPCSDCKEACDDACVHAIGFCASHDDCDHSGAEGDRYCQASNTCADCAFCPFRQNSITGACPEGCTDCQQDSSKCGPGQYCASASDVAHDFCVTCQLCGRSDTSLSAANETAGCPDTCHCASSDECHRTEFCGLDNVCAPCAGCTPALEIAGTCPDVCYLDLSAGMARPFQAGLDTSNDPITEVPLEAASASDAGGREATSISLRAPSAARRSTDCRLRLDLLTAEVTHLDISGQCPSEGDLEEVVRRCPRVVRIIARDAGITSLQWLYNSSLPLEVLDLSENRIESCNLTALPPTLRDLYLRDNRLTMLVGEQATLGNQTAPLRFLDLRGNALASLPRLSPLLEVLQISNNPALSRVPVTDGGLRHLVVLSAASTALAGLVSIEVDAVGESTRSRRAAGEGNNATEPSRNGTETAYPALRGLDLSGTQFSSLAQLGPGVLPSLEHFSVNDNPNLTSLAQLNETAPNVMYLHAANCSLTNVGDFGELRRLLRLSVSHNNISSFQPLSMVAPQLERAQLNNMRVPVYVHNTTLPRTMLEVNFQHNSLMRLQGLDLGPAMVNATFSNNPILDGEFARVAIPATMRRLIAANVGMTCIPERWRNTSMTHLVLGFNPLSCASGWDNLPPTAEEVRIHTLNDSVPRSALAILLPNLRVLEWRHPAVTSLGPFLPFSAGLVSLQLRMNALAELPDLSGAHSMRRLVIAHTEVSELNVDWLPRALTTLGIEFTSLERIAGGTWPPTLELINLDNTRLASFGNASFGPAVRAVTCVGCRLSGAPRLLLQESARRIRLTFNAGLTSLANIVAPGLEVLEIIGCGVSQLVLPHSMPQLRRIYAEGNAFDLAETPSALHDAPRLEHVRLDYTRTTTFAGVFFPDTLVYLSARGTLLRDIPSSSDLPPFIEVLHVQDASLVDMLERSAAILGLSDSTPAVGTVLPEAVPDLPCSLQTLTAGRASDWQCTELAAHAPVASANVSANVSASRASALCAPRWECHVSTGGVDKVATSRAYSSAATAAAKRDYDYAYPIMAGASLLAAAALMALLSRWHDRRRDGRRPDGRHGWRPAVTTLALLTALCFGLCADVAFVCLEQQRNTYEAAVNCRSAEPSLQCAQNPGLSCDGIQPFDKPCGLSAEALPGANSSCACAGYVCYTGVLRDGTYEYYADNLCQPRVEGGLLIYLTLSCDEITEQAAIEAAPCGAYSQLFPDASGSSACQCVSEANQCVAVAGTGADCDPASGAMSYDQLTSLTVAALVVYAVLALTWEASTFVMRDDNLWFTGRLRWCSFAFLVVTVVCEVWLLTVQGFYIATVDDWGEIVIVSLVAGAVVLVVGAAHILYRLWNIGDDAAGNGVAANAPGT